MQERLFESFIDPVDGVLCIPAESDAPAIEREAAAHGLRFPLLLERTGPLFSQVASSPFAPASSRYGPYCDNIPGMNWELPDGRKVRIGERVVKSTTGYDLLRFLLGTGGRYGRPLDYVLRLRPACGTSGVFLLRGEPASLRGAVQTLLRSCWMHWFESVDFIAENDQTPFLRVAVHCPEPEWPAYQRFLSEFATPFGLSLHAEKMEGMAYDGCPDLVVKTSPEFVIDTALGLTAHPGVKCVALCYCAAIHVFLPSAARMAETVEALARPLETALHRIGGDWQSRHVAPPLPAPPESAWIETLKTQWNIP